MRQAARAPRALACLALGALLTLGPSARRAAGPGSAAGEAGLGALELLSRLESAWRARDAESYLGLFDHASAEARQEETRFALGHFGADETQLRLDRPASIPAGLDRIKINADVFTVREPQGRIEQWVLTLERREEGFLIADKELVSEIEGLIHLSLDAAGVRADGLSLRFEDFELRMERGTLFLSPESVGPTALAFVGEGSVRVSPKPEAEQEQLRQFCGRGELTDRVEAAFLRLHPADLHRVLDPVRLEPDPDAQRRFPAAQRLMREQGSRSYVVDMPGPRSPWWLLPSLGDASIAFETEHLGTLTFTVSGSEPEGISLFERARRRQICLYPRQGGSTRYSEDEDRSADIVRHDLRVRFEPGRELLEGEDRLHLRMLAATTTLRLKLDSALRVESVTSEAGRHLFFRVRGQDSLMVSLGTLSGRLGDLFLSVRYSGRLGTGAIDDETIQIAGQQPTPQGASEEDVPIEPVQVYTNRIAWYPQAGTDDHAEADLRLDVPAGLTAVTGGRRVSARVENDRSIVEYRLERPGKYLSVAIGRLLDLGPGPPGEPELRGFAIPRLRGTGAETLRLASQILAFFSRQFGPCPYPALSLALIEGRVPGGHSPPGMVLLQQRPPLLKSPLRDDPASFWDIPGFFLAHELAHQWWGQAVAGQNYRERWLSEGFAHYAAALWARHSLGEDAFQGVLRRMARWALRETGEGPISLGYRLGRLKEEPQVFRALVYDKGAYVLHMLRGVVGDEAFFGALRSLQANARYSKIGTDDLREALEAAANRPLGAYFDSWIFGTRLPALAYSFRAVGKGTAHSVAVEVKASDLPGAVPLTITVSHRQGRSVERVLLPQSGGSFTFELPAAPVKVELNTDRGLLATVVKG